MGLKMFKRMTFAPVPLALLLASPAQAAIKYSVTELKPLPGFARGMAVDQSYGLNNAGQAVGRLRLTGSIGDRAAVWDRQGHATQLATPDGTWFSKADGINDAGVISGDIGVGAPGDQDTRRGVRWATPNSYQFIVPDNGHFSTGDVINDNGWIGGIRFNTPVTDPVENFTAYVWSPDGTIRWIDPALANGQIEWVGINSSNIFTGVQFQRGDESGESFSAVTWTEAGGVAALSTRPGNLFTSPGGINDAGIVIGDDFDGELDTGLWWDPSGNVHTFAFLPNTTSSVVVAINNKNVVTGWSTDFSSGCDAFTDFTCRRAALWDLNGHVADLNDLIDSSLGYTLLAANDINDLGEIYGEAIDQAGRRFLFLARPVPEPATWAMMVLGFALSGTAMRRRVRLAIA